MSIHQERREFSVKEGEREQDAPISRDRIERDKKMCFNNGLYLIGIPLAGLVALNVSVGNSFELFDRNVPRTAEAGWAG